jgi:hypothetical protein
MNLRDHGRIAAPNLWKSMIVHPTYKVRRAVGRRLDLSRKPEIQSPQSD